MEKSSDAVVRDAGPHFQAQALEVIGNELRGAHFAIGQLGMLMNVPPPFEHAGLDGTRELIELRLVDLRRSGCADDQGRGGQVKLFSIDLTGYNEQRIQTPAFASDPAWSPLLE